VSASRARTGPLPRVKNERGPHTVAGPSENGTPENLLAGLEDSPLYRRLLQEQEFAEPLPEYGVIRWPLRWTCIRLN
jgi:hypothetical protein